jgi:peptidoglycan hydrolase-like protein with peptidoglycan-binding domain
VRSKSRNKREAVVEDDVIAGNFVLRSLGWSLRDAIGVAVAVTATVMILGNVLFMQSGRHPAPIFKNAQPPVLFETTSTVGALPRARPADPIKTGAGRPVIDLVTEIQKELTRRGFYDGPVDGVYGSKTDAAIRDFEQTAGLKPTPEPNEVLLRAIQRSNAKQPRGAAGPIGRSPQTRPDPISEVLAPSQRVLALQRALADYGFGQIKPTGVVDHETQAAIEKFERERKLPVTGQPSERVARELGSITGRPLE